MKSRRFVTLDVFTDKRFTGNQLAVVLDSEGLETEAMQAIAREFNLSETVFVQPPQDSVNLSAVRIFMPGGELPFAGHPTVGSAVLLAMLNKASIGHDLNFTIEEKIGLVPCTVRLSASDTGRARFELPKLPYEAGEAAPAADIAEALGLDASDIGFGNHVPSRFGVGAPFTFVPLKSRDALDRAAIHAQHWAKAFGTDSHNAAHLYTPGGVSPDASFDTRMFAPGMGVTEDPATGSAAASFAGVLMKFQPSGNGQHTYVIEQGRVMGRPSRIVLGLDVWDGALTGGTIGGEAVVVSEGTITA
ncbi:PhzF family phenazine biosynthesis protein [Flaviflagellibacter deserti]|uniref:PhzF family phenazine biosynthesis protein n=1 Tax=Flaviflagellibacter deserti TaxID=2267266 RepID=A0ABV9Z4W5_9HYPH